jgi:hypothetical protein
MRQRLLTIPGILLAAILLSGCLYSREIARTRRDIERQYPEARFDREIVLSLGPGSIHLLRFLTGIVPEDNTEMARAYLRDISRVKVGVYRVENLPALNDIDLTRLQRFGPEDGWKQAARLVDEDQVTWLMYRERQDTVRDLYILTLDGEELVLVRLKGRLSRLLERAMKDHEAF